ncbi:hypothetical protein GCM10018793_20780 [Streptomyces sulfonofaciens]|uniref:Uncharacterized protein n=1 Tax=Streptomyces sulfonofaciens TaxID=68272 RepID=A0A919G0P8_9ACTN|nr:hypothetical protein GCM10018793_20780 [Streptomyces sulfonofaciens]
MAAFSSLSGAAADARTGCGGAAGVRDVPGDVLHCGRCCPPGSRTELINGCGALSMPDRRQAVTGARGAGRWAAPPVELRP